MMTDEEMFQRNYEHYCGLFPRSCSNCGRTFDSLRDYILQTSPLGSAHSYDVEHSDWKPQQPLGGTAMANCVCGNTLSLTTSAMPVELVHEMLDWIKAQSVARGISADAVIEIVRAEVRRRALS